MSTKNKKKNIIFQQIALNGLMSIYGVSLSHAQLSDEINDCGELVRNLDGDIPLSKAERISAREKEVIELVDQSESCAQNQSGGGSGGGGGGSNGGDAGSGKSFASSEGFGNELVSGEQSVSSSQQKGFEVVKTSQSQPQVANNPTLAESEPQNPRLNNGSVRKELEKVDNNERLIRQLEEKMKQSKTPEIRQAYQKKIDELRK